MTSQTWLSGALFPKAWATLALVALVAPLGCTNAELVKIPPPEGGAADNKLRVRGEFCTTDPDDLKFPVKVLFVIDTSSSMDTTDPLGTRTDAIIEVIDELRDQDGVEFGVIAFGLGANILTDRCDDYENRTNCTPGFATDPDAAIAAAVGTGQAAGTTDYLITLQAVVSMLADDMALSDAADRANGTQELQSARYVVMFLSDGIPDADSTFSPQRTCSDAQQWVNSGRVPGDRGLVPAIAELVDQMQALAARYEVRELSFNGAFVAAPDLPTDVRACGANLIRGMSAQGLGTFRDFSAGEGINFLFVDFTSFKRVFALKNMVVANLNARPFSEAIGADFSQSSDDPTLAAGIIDSDADGLTDQLEERIGTSIFLQDSDGDGFSDLIEYRLRTSGLDALDPTDADCIFAEDRLDGDGDGLRDCEERFAGTNPGQFDSDLDGFSDGLELLYGTNPSLPDNLVDVDFDGAGNAAEMRWHSQPGSDDVSYLSQHAYRYDVTETGVVDARSCYAFDVSNISLASTQGALSLPDEDEAPGLGGGAMQLGENRILIEVAEAPFDTPGQQGLSRIACATARFSAADRIKVPANGVVELTADDFVLATEFDPAVHCVGANQSTTDAP